MKKRIGGREAHILKEREKTQILFLIQEAYCTVPDCSVEGPRGLGRDAALFPLCLPIAPLFSDVKKERCEEDSSVHQHGIQQALSRWNENKDGLPQCALLWRVCACGTKKKHVNVMRKNGSDTDAN